LLAVTNNKEINIHETIIENEITTTTTVIYNQKIGTITTVFFYSFVHIYFLLLVTASKQTA